MICDTFIPNRTDSWIDGTPFMLWEIGHRRVIEHWMDALFRSNSTMRLWLEKEDPALQAFINATYPLCRRVQVQIGQPSEAKEACTFINDLGAIVLKKGQIITPYLPAQPAAQSYFAMIKKWLHEMQTGGTQLPELETVASPGVIVGHHSRIAQDTTLIAPCWIGNGCTISGASIGPNAVIGDHSIIAQGAQIAESYVLRGTFVGANVVMNGLVAGRKKGIAHATGEVVPLM